MAASNQNCSSGDSQQGLTILGLSCLHLHTNTSYYILKELEKICQKKFVAHLCLQSEWFIWGLPSSTATILQYTNVTGPNQSGSSWETSCNSAPEIAPWEVQVLGIVLQFQEYYTKNCTSSICCILLLHTLMSAPHSG